MSMKLSLALRKVKDLKGRVSELDGRIRQSVTWEQNSPPVWEYKELMEKRAGLIHDLIVLKSLIAMTNANTFINFEGKEISLTLAVIMLSEIKGLLELYKSLDSRAQEHKEERSTTWEPYENDYSRRNKVETVTVTHCALTILQKAKEVDELKEQFQKLNDVVEMANASTSLTQDGTKVYHPAFQVGV